MSCNAVDVLVLQPFVQVTIHHVRGLLCMLLLRENEASTEADGTEVGQEESVMQPQVI